MNYNHHSKRGETMIQALENSTKTVLSEQLVPDLLERYIRYIDASPKTIETYSKALRQFWQYMQLHEITAPTRADILAYREDLAASGHKPTTISGYITAIRLFFRWTAQEGLYHNIADHLKGAKIDRAHKKDYLNCAQVKEILKNIDTRTLQGKRDYAILTTMITGGLRDIEIHRANIEDIRALGDSTVLMLQGKGHEEKTDYIKLSAPVEKAIRSYLKARGSSAGADPLFISLSNNSKGQRITTRAISGIVKDRLRAAGYDSERLTAHSLRHTAITLSLIAGKDITEVQQFARHSDISTTMIYNHALDKSKNSCNEAISAAIF